MARNQKIVDLGSGGNPDPSAGIIVDKYLTNVSRGKDIAMPEDAQFIIADIEQHLPFKDKCMDYSYAKHVLEHVEQPDKACREIIRISKAGYIETPTWLWEILFGRRYHLWLVKKENNKLVFTRKNDVNCPSNTFDGDELYANNKQFHDMFVKNVDLFSVRFHWKGEFSFSLG